MRMKRIRFQDTGLKYTSDVISNFRSASVVFGGHPENLTTTYNTHRCHLTRYFKKKGHFAINVILTEFQKLGCSTFHSYDAEVGIIKLSIQSPLT